MVQKQEVKEEFRQILISLVSVRCCKIHKSLDPLSHAWLLLQEALLEENTVTSEFLLDRRKETRITSFFFSFFKSK